MVGRVIPPAGDLVDTAIDASFGDRRRPPDVVEPHPLIHAERPFRVVPKGILAHLPVDLPEEVREPPPFQVEQGLALPFREMNLVFESGRVPYIQLVRGDIEVAAE